jgi:putative hydrolase of the HAD superfamily
VPHREFFPDGDWWGFLRQKIRACVLELTGDPYTAERTAAAIRNEYLDKTKWHLFLDSLPAIERAEKAGYTNYILSNHVPELDDIIRSLGLGGRFAAVFNSGRVGYEKPNSGIFRFALEISGVAEPSTAVMIGDGYIPDVVGARSNGMNAILVRGTNPTGYEYYAPDLEDALDLVPAVIEARKSVGHSPVAPLNTLEK